MCRPRAFAAAWAGALAVSLFAAGRTSAIVPPNPERGATLRKTFAALAGRLEAARRPQQLSFRPLAPGEVRTLNALVLLVDFSDNPAARPVSEFEELFFSSGSQLGGSLRDYYDENSNGRLIVAGAVVGWLRAPQTYAYYVNGASGFGSYPRSAQRLAEDAIALARGRVDFAPFDNDGPDGVPSSADDDGYVDALLLVHAGPGAEDSHDPAHQIWSHSSATTREIPGDGAIGFFYAMTPEIGRLGVHCHEFGHTLGLPDLYDTTPPEEPDSNGLGLWSLMAIGSWAGPPGQAGARPAHIDPWCKARLGFVDPIVLERNREGAVLRPVEEGGEVYRLWTNGAAGPEYFLAENRRPAPGNFDRYLPGGGLLVYHVDEVADDNDDPNRYRVALLQADGLRDLEEQRNAGDAGDPYPGSAGRRALTQDTDPSSRSHARAPTQVSVTGIESSDPGAVVANLVVEDRPAFRAASVRAHSGDAWPWLRWGDTAPLEVTVTNSGIAAGEATAALLIDDPRVSVAGGPVSLGELGEDESAHAAFDVTTDAMEADTTLAISARLLVAHGGEADTLGLLLTIGRRFGLATGFESDRERAGWTHAPALPGRSDRWGLTEKRAHGGASSYRFTNPARETYDVDSDGALVSPPVLLGVASRLSFWHWISAERETGRYAYDGGRVEISMENGPWIGIEPEGGYPYRLDPFSTTAFWGLSAYSGEGEGWRQANFDLARFSGSARFRFRFVSDQDVNREGWYIDDVVVSTLPQRFRVALPAPISEGGRIRIAWSVEEVLGPYDGTGFRLYRTTAPVPGSDPSQGYELVAEVPADSAGSFTIVDANVTEGRLYSYLLVELDASGATRGIYGPESRFLTPASGPVSVAAPFPNPFRPADGVITLSYVIPGTGTAPGGVARLALYDVRGRRVRVLDERPAVPGRVTVRWDGRDASGRDAASGFYIVRLESARGNAAQRFLLVR